MNHRNSKGSNSGYLIPPATTRETIRAWDEDAIHRFGIPGVVLMENAGESCVRVIEDLLAVAAVKAPFRIICGPGNNGGDGLVIARHLFNRGIEVIVYLAVSANKVRADSDAEIQLNIARRMGIPLHEPPGDGVASESLLREATSSGTIVDALFGTGLSRPVGDTQRAWIEAINRCGLAVVAIDIPSGLDANSGEVLGVAVGARWTLTFVASKTGFQTASGKKHTGEVHVLGISIPRQLLEPPSQLE